MRTISKEKTNPLQLAFEYHSNTILPDKELKQQEEDEKEKVIQYVLKEWIGKYFRMKLMAETTKIPSVTSNYSDIPIYAKGDFHSKTESAALKTVTTQEWLDYFHSRLKRLPKLHQQIIEKKYLISGNDGKYAIDDSVYNELHLGRTYYFMKKKEALYWFGLALLSPIAEQDQDG